MVETPGNLLKKQRESKNLSIAQVAKSTRVRAVYLQAMESDDFAALPSPVHARGFLRVYADFIGLDPEVLIEKLSSELRFKTIEKFVKDSKFGDNQKSEPTVEDTPRTSISRKTVGMTGQSSDKIPNFSDEIEENALDLSFPNPEPSHSTPTQSNIIFSSIGNKLRNQREELGLSLNEVEKQSHVLKRYLVSIEAGEFENLPSSVQARGMLTNYASFLEIDTDEILLRFAEGLQTQLLEKQVPGSRKPRSAAESKNRISALRRYISIDLIFGGVLIILLIFFAVWGTGKVIDLYNSPASISNAESISDIILTPIQSATAETLAFTPTVLLASSSPGFDSTQILEIPVNAQGQVQVNVVVLQRTWLRISVDNKVLLEGRVEPGNAYSFNGNNQVEVLTGNGAALQIYHNQMDLGIMGSFGEIVDTIYTANAILKPTATITPTPTITPVPSVTPRVTSTEIP
jgi:cytoskeleton protein RodZ